MINLSKKKKNMFLYIFLILLIGIIKSEDRKNITIDFDDSEKRHSLDSLFLETDTYYYDITFNSSVNTSYYLELMTSPDPLAFTDITLQMFASVSEKSPSRSSFDWIADKEDGNILYIKLSTLKNINDSKLFLGLKCYPSCKGSIHYSFKKMAMFRRNHPITYLVNSYNEELEFKYKYIEGSDDDFFNVYAIGGEPNDVVNFSCTVMLTEEKIGEKITPKKNIIFNGIIADFNTSWYPEGEETNQSYFYCTVKGEINSVITVGFTIINYENVIKPNIPPIYGVLNFNWGHNFFLFNDDDPEAEISNSTLYLINVVSPTNHIKLLTFSDFEHKTDDLEMKVTDYQNYILLNYSYLQDNPYFSIEQTDDSIPDMGFSVQIMRLDDNLTNHLTDPQVNGIPYTRYLPYNIVQSYRHYKHEGKETEETNYNTKELAGRVRTYLVKCDNFPDCQYSPDWDDEEKRPSNVIIPRSINGFHTIGVKGDYESHILDSKQYMYFVKCLSKSGCDFSTSFFDEDEAFKIPQFYRLLQIIKKGQNDLYEFEISPNDHKNFEGFYVILNTFTGDSSMEITRKNGTFDNITIDKRYPGNAEIFNYKGVLKDMIGTYTIKVRADSPSFYTIAYFVDEGITEKMLNIEGGLAFIHGIEQKQGVEITYQYRDGEKGNNYFTNIYTLNCRINVIFDPKKKHEKILMNDTFIQHMPPSFEDDDESSNGRDIKSGRNFTYYIEFSEFEHPESESFNNELCMFYTAAFTDSNEQELVIDENNPFEFELKQELRQINILFPRPPNTGNVIANINLEISALMNVTTFIENKNIDTILFTRSTKIRLADDLKEYCPEDQICSIIFHIECLDKEALRKEVPFEITVKTNAHVPSFLKESRVRNDIVQAGEITYFMADIGPIESGEITLNFNRGSGRLVARKMRKDHVDKNPNWNGRVKLPIPDDKELTDYLDYDYFSQTLSYSGGSSCSDIGCEIYIGVVSDDDYNLNKTTIKPINTFTIYLRTDSEKEGAPIVDIAANEYAYGALEGYVEYGKEEDGHYDYYSIIFANDAEEIVVDLQCENCFLLINKGSKKPLDFEEGGYDFKITSSEKVKYINKSLIVDKKNGTVPSLKDCKITIGLGTYYRHYERFSPYSFRISAPDIRRPMILESGSDQIIQCKIRNDFCDFVILKENYDVFYQMVIFTYSDNLTANLVIYANSINHLDFETLNKSEIEKKLPRPYQKETKSSVDNLFTDNLYLDLSTGFSEYILVSVHSSNGTVVSLMTTFREYMVSTIPNPFNKQLFLLPNNTSIDLKLPTYYMKEEGQNEFIYIGHLVSINGTGKAHYLKDDSSIDYVNIKNPKDSLSQSFNISGDYLNVKSVPEDNLIFYYWYTQRHFQVNFDKIDYGKSGQINFPSFEFPFVVYAKVYDEKENITVNLHLWDLVKNEPYSDVEDFIVSGIMVNQSFVTKQTLEVEYVKIDESKIINGKYDISTKTARITFSSKYIKSFDFKKENKYFYIKVEKSKDNVNKYKSLRMDYSILPFNNVDMLTPYDFYVNGNLLRKQKTPNVYLLHRHSPKDNKMELEFSAVSDFVDFSIRFSLSEDPYQNSTSFLSAKKIGGKVICEFTVLNKKKIYLSVFSSKKRHIVDYEGLSNFVFKYKTSTIDKYLLIDNTLLCNETTTTDPSNYTVTCYINTIHKKNNNTSKYLKNNEPQNAVAAKYYANLFYTFGIEDGQTLETIAMNNQKIQKNYEFIYAGNEDVFKIVMSKFPHDVAYSISLIGVVNEDHEMFAYTGVHNPFNIDDNTIDINKITKKQIDIPSRVAFFNLFFQKGSEKKNNYVSIKAKSNNKANPIYLYMSIASEKPLRKDAIFISSLDQNGNALMYIPISYLYNNAKNKTSQNITFYLSSEGLENCKFDFEFEFTEHINLVKDEPFIHKMVDGIDNYTAVYYPSLSSEDIINIFVLGGNTDYLIVSLDYIKISKDEDDNLIEEEISQIDYEEDAFFNGYVYCLKEKDYGHGYLLLRYFGDVNDTFTLHIKKVSASGENPKLIPGGPAIYGYMDSAKQSKLQPDCYQIDTTDDSENQTYAIEILSKTGIEFYYYDSYFAVGNNTVDIQATYTTNKTFMTTYKFCLIPEGASETLTGKAGFSIQVNYLNKEEEYALPNIEPQVNGILYTHFQTYKQIKYYRHLKHKCFQTEETNFNAREELGEIKAYLVYCRDFPHCYYDHDDLNDSKDKDIKVIKDTNGFFTIGVKGGEDFSIFDSEQYLFFVECLDSAGCEFTTSFFDENEKMYLTENYQIVQVMQEHQTDKYVFNVKSSNWKKIVVNLQTISGDSNMDVSSSKEITFGSFKPYWVGNTEIHEFDDKEKMIAEYTITISADEGNFYKLSYNLISDNELEYTVELIGGFTSLETIPGEEGARRQFEIENKYGANFVTHIKPINCNIKVFFIFQKQKIEILPYDNFFQHFIPFANINNTTSIYNRYSEFLPHNDEKIEGIVHKYIIENTGLDHEKSFEGERCALFISSTQVYSDTELVVNEANPFEFRLNDELTQIKLLFPRPPDGKTVIADFKLEQTTTISLKVLVDNQEIENLKFSKSRALTIPENLLDGRVNLCQKGQVCNIIFHIEAVNLEEIHTGSSIEFLVKSEHDVPSLLKKKRQAEDIVTTGHYAFFVFDVEHEESGEISLNFNRGSGLMVAKIISKNNSEENADWNGKVVLPRIGMKDGKYSKMLPYDSFTKTISYNNKTTFTMCKTYGCEIYVGVYSDDVYQQEKKTFVNDFTIYSRPFAMSKDKPTIIDISMNEYIYGAIEYSLEKNATYLDYYTTISVSEGQEVIFEFQSESCVMYIGNGSDIPTKDSNILMINGTGDALKRLSKNDLKVKSLKDLRLTVAIGAYNLDSIYTAPYDFRIYIPKDYSNSKKNGPRIIEASSDQNVLNEIEDVSKPCYFQIPIYAYDYVNQITVFAKGINYPSRTVIYAKACKMFEFDQISGPEIIDKFPTKKDYDFTSMKNIYSEFIEIDLGTLMIDQYVLLAVYSDQPTIIKLISTFRMQLVQTGINPSTWQMYTINKNHSLSLTLPNEHNFMAHFVTIIGNALVTLGNDTSQLKGTKDSYSFTINKGDKEKNKQIVIKNPEDSDTSFTFYSWISVRSEKENFDELEYGVSSEYFYSNNDFPIRFFIKVQREEDVEVVFNMFKFTKANNNNFIDSLNIKGTIESFERVLARRIDNKKPLNNMNIKGTYDSTTKTGKILFSEADIKNSKIKNKYLVIEITKTSKNENKYSKLDMKVTVFPLSEIHTTIPYNNYFSGQLSNLTNVNIHKFIKKSEKDNLIRVEFSTNTGGVKYGIMKSLPTSYYINNHKLSVKDCKNETEGLTEISKEGGKGVVDVNLKTLSVQEIYLCVVAANTTKDISKTDYVFKYKSAENEFLNYKVSNKSVKVVNKKHPIDISIEALTDSELNVVAANYYIRIVKASDVKKGKFNLDTISMIKIDAAAPLVEYKSGSEQRKFNVEIKKFPTGAECYISVIAVNEEMEMFAMGHTKLKINSKAGLIAFGAIFAVVALVAIITVFFYFKQKRKSEDALKNLVEQTSFAQASLADQNAFGQIDNIEGEF